jgi:hypothetical protein
VVWLNYGCFEGFSAQVSGTEVLAGFLMALGAGVALAGVFVAAVEVRLFCVLVDYGYVSVCLEVYGCGAG